MLDSSLRALRESRMSAAEIEARIRIQDRSRFLIGALPERLESVGNVIYRPFKVVGAFVLGSSGAEPPPMPEVPEGLRGDLGDNIEAAFKARLTQADTRYQAMSKLTNFDLTGYNQANAQAAHNEARQDVLLPEEQQQSSGPSMLASLGTLAVSTPGVQDAMRNFARNAVGATA